MINACRALDQPDFLAAVLRGAAVRAAGEALRGVLRLTGEAEEGA